jgi:hypothetical protein
LCLVYSYSVFVYKDQESWLVNILFQYGVSTADVGLFQMN